MKELSAIGSSRLGIFLSGPQIASSAIAGRANKSESESATGTGSSLSPKIPASWQPSRHLIATLTQKQLTARQSPQDGVILNIHAGLRKHRLSCA